jgi:hypothetical protein
MLTLIALERELWEFKRRCKVSLVIAEQCSSINYVLILIEHSFHFSGYITAESLSDLIRADPNLSLMFVKRFVDTDGEQELYFMMCYRQ